MCHRRTAPTVEAAAAIVTRRKLPFRRYGDLGWDVIASGGGRILSLCGQGHERRIDSTVLLQQRTHGRRSEFKPEFILSENG
jgi:hypothetical protein